MSTILRPIMRPEVNAIFEAERITRQARRILISGPQPAGESERHATTTLINNAIAQLVAARVAINSNEGEPT